jgi:hypothetical protein
MKIDFNAPLYDLDGNTIKETNEPDSKAATLGLVVKTALLAGPDDSKMEAAEKVKLFDLACTVSDSMKANKPAELEVEDVALIKGRCKHLPVGIIGPVYKLLKG